MNHENIGRAAGLVWQRLRDQDDGVTLSALKKTDGLKADEIVAAVGWLARENKVWFEESGNRVTVKLCDHETVC